MSILVIHLRYKLTVVNALILYLCIVNLNQLGRNYYDPGQASCSMDLQLIDVERLTFTHMPSKLRIL